MQALQLPFAHQQPHKAWGDLVGRWRVEAARSKSLRTIELEGYVQSWLEPRLSALLLSQIDWDVVDGIVLELTSSPLAASTINRYLSLLRAMLNAAVEWRWLAYVPKVPQVKDRAKRDRWLTFKEAQKLLTQLPDHLRDMAAFSLETGLRRSNVTGLRWSQVDLSHRMAWIYADESKGGKSIPVPLSDTACALLRALRGVHREFCFTYRGRPVKQTNTKAWRSALDRAGIKDFRWHDLRHTWASWHAQGGTPREILQVLGGWRDGRMVQRYAHLAVRHLQPHVDRLHKSLRRRKKRSKKSSKSKRKARN